MEDCLMITYDCCPSDAPTLCVARREENKLRILNTIQGEEAFGIYHYLTDGAELKNVRDIPKKPKKHRHITIHSNTSMQHGLHFITTCHCPNCGHTVEEYEDGWGTYSELRNNYCNKCGQALKWK